MSDRLTGKVALITGGTSGIGETSVERFVEEGALVMIAARSRTKGEAMCAALGANVAFVETDVVHEAQIETAVAATVERFGKLDILFSNAGAPTPGGGGWPG